MDAVLSELPPARRAILVALRKRGEARADELSAALGITSSAVRQHLSPLAAAGWVEHRDERAEHGGPGRPRRVYRLTPAADSLFPKAYGELTTELLDHVGAEDPELLARAFERRRRTRVEQAQARLAGRDFEGRVRELAAILDEAGYLADVEPLEGGGFRIAEHNCAILAVAKRHGHACTTELGFLQEVLPDADVRRVAHIVSGSTACVYEVRPRVVTAAA
ncbi:MAG TPA: ArsR family transcriptional regulator [Capillimicrobium sp.]|nr:ArsR family transcriptional regulator [Capillimicrobium sp.]